MKTTQEWIHTIACEHTRAAALRHACDIALGEEARSLVGALAGAFSWDGTEEGYDFWMNVALGSCPAYPSRLLPTPKPAAEEPKATPEQLQTELDRLRAVLRAFRVELSGYRGPDVLENAHAASWYLRGPSIELPGNRRPTVDEWVAAFRPDAEDALNPRSEK